MATEELKVKITAEAEQAQKELSKFQKSVKSFSSGFTKAVGAFAKGVGVVAVAGGTAIAAITKQAVQSYAEYEQLSGGVQKLFGESSDQLLAYAQDAYKTAGMSANQYMELSTSFAASLIQSYGGDTSKAVGMTDVAMRAISDNFNTFGGDINSIQNAFQGFAKQNYTMLDNLKLGYGGTKSEMERLIADANEYGKSIGLAGDLSIDSFGDIVQAIDLVQQKQGIAGTTAKEAATTISGSLGMVQAAWANLLVALADGNADLSGSFDALVTSAEIAFNNILPVAEQALMGIGTLIEGLAPVLGAKLPELVANVAPSLMGAITGLISSLATSLPAMITPVMDAIIAALPDIVSAGVQMFAGLVVAVAQVIPDLIGALPAIWEALKTGFIEAWPAIKEAGQQLMEQAGEGIAQAGDAVKAKAGEIWDGIKSKASEVWTGITSSISAAWGNIKSAVSTGINAVKTTVSSVFNSVRTKVSIVWNSIKSSISTAINGAKQAVDDAIQNIIGFFDFDWSLPDLKLPHFSITGSFSLNPPSVPKLSIDWYEKGGVFDKPTLFSYGNNNIGGLGENGAEAVVPLEKNVEWLDKIAERLGDKIGSQPIVLEIDGKVFGQIACDSINGLTRQTGRLNLIMA